MFEPFDAPEQLAREQLIREHLRGYGGLSDLQYGLCRDAGYDASQLDGLTVSWFGSIKAKEMHDGSDAASARQVHYLQQTLGVDLSFLSFAEARYRIRTLAIEQGNDERYLDYVKSAMQRAESDAARSRANRAKDKTKRQPTASPNPKVDISLPKKATVTIDADSDEISKLITLYQETFLKHFGHASTERIVHNVRLTLAHKVREFGYDAVANAVQAYLLAHDHAGYEIALHRLASSQSRLTWIFDKCLSLGSTTDFDTLRLADATGMTAKQLASAIRRGDVVDTQYVSYTLVRDNLIKRVMRHFKGDMAAYSDYQETHVRFKELFNGGVIPTEAMCDEALAEFELFLAGLAA